MLRRIMTAMTILLGISSMVSLTKVPWYRAIEGTEWFYWVQMVFSAILLIVCVAVIMQQRREKG